MMQKCTVQCERLFNSFDEDKDGKITPLQLQNCIASIGGGLSVTEAEMVAQPLVSGADGLVGLDEFACLVESERKEEKMEDLKKAFNMYTILEEDECSITPRSLKRMLNKIIGDDDDDECWSLDECCVMIHHFDVNGDGVLSFQEFIQMMQT